LKIPDCFCGAASSSHCSGVFCMTGIILNGLANVE
jgi:hypothetical protein